MKNLFFLMIAAAVFVISACDHQSGVNQPLMPERSATFMKHADQLDLSNDQLGEIEEVFYLNQDFGLILDAGQVATMNSLLEGAVSFAGDERPDPRKFFDMAALVWYRLALRANPDLTEEQKTSIKEAIAASNRTRLDILKNTELSQEQKRQALLEEHNRLMAEINGTDDTPGILLPQQVEKTRELLQEIEQKREERREKMVERRIDQQIRHWTRLMQLDQEQQLKIKDILLEQNQKVKELRELYKDDPEMFRQKMIELQKDTNKDIRDLLDERQKAIWDRIHGVKPGGGRG